MTTVNLAAQAYSSSNPLSDAEASASSRPESIAEVSINRILECAVILSWKEYMPSQAGLVHIEYRTRTDRSLAYAKVWSSPVRGEWDLVCEYFADPSPLLVAGLTVEKINASSILAQMLTAIMQNQGRFTKPAEAGKHVVVQVYPPSAADISLAESVWASCVLSTSNELTGVQEDSAKWENEGGRSAA